jgi:UDP-2,3-diacylglucosamine hydrolase
MSHSRVTIKKGAFVIADAHYSSLRPELLEFIKAIESKKLLPTQLILMGDIFDALFGNVAYTCEKNLEIIELINKISTDIEIIILEGNHDFNLKNIFLNAKVFTISQQPLLCSYDDKRVYIAHGDFDVSLGYKIYTTLIRNPYILKLLSYIDTISSNTIIKKLDKKLSIKDDCKDFVGFSKLIEKRLAGRYECDYFVEGHFHQNRVLKLKDFSYINLAAFACNQRYFSVNLSQDKELLEEKIFSKGIDNE